MTFDHDFSRLRAGNGDTLRDVEIDIVAVTQVQLERVPLNGGTITDAVDFKLFLEGVLHTVNQVGHDGAGHPPLLTRALGFTARHDADSFAINGDGDVVGRCKALGAFRPLHLDGLTRKRGRHTRGQLDRFFPNTRHEALLRTPCKALRRRHWLRVHLRPTSRPWTC